MQLILGGARSGKSRFAQQQAEAWQDQTGGQLLYLATAEPGDDEMQARIQMHQGDRGERWQSLEEPLQLANALRQNSGSDTCVVIDCLTLWVNNCLHHAQWEAQKNQLLRTIDDVCRDGPAPHWIFVSNEVGSGIVPLGQLSREFVDASGWLHQALAARAESVTLVVAGLPLALKTAAQQL
ncbi:bifunctional adenosylcobinamide kinase/adenosylcobinamide-phosphate guanylyltransferase [Gilvimarinus sp. DA14]|uniref:bifunctional adenosylcobinamide kinase/adenosylcobinamide-phosphate guanylyltransferase n=1 Tax=Gilvimarinus sp. DA14 TaxID=2956798 RepID=UPI0020B65ED2|nr:bifunctional adenosylcobinamide kinase/adenosylcobinamide-phosphate guanylyltransferase [Gilvimarinus sp. DA14]UTF60097.1 bifunctional adenosylcobinamide kinase/adenosylcobinamide-phosphate guanylyltransferase [Gilvimarinus sp. DA14]